MKLTPEQLYLYNLAYKFYNDICDYVGFEEQYRFKPGGGKWVIDFYKQMETALRLSKGHRLSSNPIQGPEAHIDTTMPPLPSYDRLIQGIQPTTETTSQEQSE